MILDMDKPFGEAVTSKLHKKNRLSLADPWKIINTVHHGNVWKSLLFCEKGKQVFTKEK